MLYEAYYEDLEQYANLQQQHAASGGPPPPGPGPFPGSVALDNDGALIGTGTGPHPTTKHPPNNNHHHGRKQAVPPPMNNGVRKGRPDPDVDDFDDDEYDDDEDEEEYDDEEEDEEGDDDEEVDEEEEDRTSDSINQSIVSQWSNCRFVQPKPQRTRSLTAVICSLLGLISLLQVSCAFSIEFVLPNRLLTSSTLISLRTRQYPHRRGRSSKE